MWEEKEFDKGRVLLYRLRDQFPEGIVRASFSCKRYNPKSNEIDTPLWMQRRNPAKLETIIAISGAGYKLSVNFYDNLKLSGEALSEQRRIDPSGRYGLDAIPDEGDYSPTDEALQGVLTKMKKLKREVLTKMEELKRNQWINFLTCQRTRTKGPAESDPHRPIEQTEQGILLPYLETIFLNMSDLQLRPPFRQPEYYAGLVQALKRA